MYFRLKLLFLGFQLVLELIRRSVLMQYNSPSCFDEGWQNRLTQELQHTRKSEPYQKAFTPGSEPLVTVCIATAARPEVLVERAIPSLLRQTYHNVQIIVVGDACDAATVKAVARVRDSRVEFENLPVRGPYPAAGINRWRVAGSNAMNRCLEKAEGTFICHLDDDDQAHERRIETLLAEAQKFRAEFIWHKFLTEFSDGTWVLRGTPEVLLGQITTGSIFYHRFFAQLPWDVYAFRRGLPGDWDRIQRILALQPRGQFCDQLLLLQHHEPIPQELLYVADEQFLAETN